MNTLYLCTGGHNAICKGHFSSLPEEQRNNTFEHYCLAVEGLKEICLNNTAMDKRHIKRRESMRVSGKSTR